MEPIRSANHTSESEKRTATQRLELVLEEFWAWATTHATTMTHNSWLGHQLPVIWSFSHLLSQAITPIEIDIHSPSTSYSSRLFLYFSNLRWSSYRQITEVDLFIYYYYYYYWLLERKESFLSKAWDLWTTINMMKWRRMNKRCRKMMNYLLLFG